MPSIFSVKKLVKRFRLTQYSESQLIKDLQLLVDELNANNEQLAAKIRELEDRIDGL